VSAGGLPDLVARVRLDTTDLDKGVKKAAGIGAGIGSAIGSMAGAGLTTAVSGIKAFAAGSVDAFAAVEDASGAAGVQFGSALPQVVSFADKAAASFGLSKRAALEAQNTFGTLGKAAGLQGAPLAGFSQKLTGLAGDLASFKGTSTEQAIEAVGAALRGESEPIRAYGVMLNDASIQAEGLAMGLAKPVVNADKLAAANMRVKIATEAYSKAVAAHGASSTEAQKAQLSLTSATNAQKAAQTGTIPPLSATNKTLAIQSLILKQTKDAQGDYSRTSSSTANVQKTLQAETENASAALGQKLAPAVTAMRQGFLALIRGSSGLIDGIGGVAGAVSPVVATLAGGLQPALAAVQGALAAVAGAIPTPVLQGLAIVLGVITAAMVAQALATAAWSAAQAAAAIVTGLFATTVNAETGATERGVIARVAHNAAVVASTVVHGIAVAATAAWTAAQWLLNAALNANPIGLVVIAIALLIAGLVLAWKHSETFRDAVTGAFNAIRDVVGAVIGWLADAVPAAWNAVKDAVVGAVNAVVGFVQDHWPLLLAILTGPIGLAVLAITAHWATIKAGVTAAWDAIKGAVTTAVDAVKGTITGAWTAISTATTTAWNAVKGAVTTAWDGIKTAITTAVDAVVSYVAGMPGRFVANLAALGGLLAGAATAAWARWDAAVDTAIAGVLGVMRALPGRIISGLGNMGQLLYGAGGDLLRGLADGIGAAVGAVVAKAKEAAHAVVDGVKGALGIHSPSTVMRDQVGLPIMQGVAAGIAGNLGMAQGALDGLAGLAPPRLGGSTAMGRGGATAPADGLPGGAEGTDMAEVVAELQALRAEVAKQNDRGLTLARSGAVA